MVKQLEISLKDLDNNDGDGGLEILIPEALSSPENEGIPIFIEYFKGQLRLLVWNGEKDPEIVNINLKGNHNSKK